MSLLHKSDPALPEAVSAPNMWITCNQARHMAKMIQLRHVPDDVHRKLKARAAEEGLSLSDYLLREVTLVAERPTRDELRRRIAGRARVKPKASPAAVVRAVRESR
jgi:antitoxin FitA